MVIVFGAWICCWVEGGAGCGPATPLECVNERERGQEESEGSTTEVLTEGIEGAEIAPVPAQQPLSRASPESRPSPGICDGGQGQSHLQRLLHLSFARGREKRGTRRGSICRGLAVVSAARPGKGPAGPPRLCHGGLSVVDHSEAHHTSHASWPGSLLCKQRLMTAQHTHRHTRTHGPG